MIIQRTVKHFVQQHNTFIALKLLQSISALQSKIFVTSGSGTL